MSKSKRSAITGKPVTTRIPAPAAGVRIETFIPWTLVKREVRRQVITPIGAPATFEEEELQAKARQEQHSPLVRAIGLAHYWLRLLDDGTFRSITAIAAAERMDVGRVSRIMRLAQLSPAITSAIIAGTSDGIPLGIPICSSIPSEWHLQRAADLNV